jgi:O-antigen ligase
VTERKTEREREPFFVTTTPVSKSLPEIFFFFHFFFIFFDKVRFQKKKKNRSMLDLFAGLAASLAVCLYRERTLAAVVPLLAGLIVFAVARLAVSLSSSAASSSKDSPSSTSSVAAAVAAAEAKHAVVLSRMKKDQEALMAAVARLEALTTGAEGAEGRRR